ncbi:hypothetical protein GCM10009681_31190 [Luedemannella helvata]|uniref:Bacterial Ig-like domain-containing protein n=1 Tax=Luedemannella helvata TaxID=349315 RepID=A0ABP4WLP1_9ACTN
MALTVAAGCLVNAPTAAAGTAVVHSDFESGTFQNWAALSSPTVITNTSGVAHSGSRSLLVSGRSAIAHGPALDVTGAIRVGIRYQLSVWVRALSVAANVNVTVSQTSAASESAVQVVSNVTVGPTRWVRLRGIYTPPIGYDRFRVRVETGNGVEPFYIDDFVLTVLESTQQPVVTGPANGAAVTDRPTIAGVGAPFTTVTVAEGSSVLCSARVNASGDWRCVPSTVLSTGTHTVTPTARDAIGIATAGHPVTFIVNQASAPAAPAMPVIGSPRMGATLAGGRVPVSGTAPASTVVTVSEDGRALCTAQAGTDGAWSCTPGGPFGPGRHILYATARDSSGRLSAARPVTFYVDTLVPWPPAVHSPAPGAIVLTRQPYVSGVAEPGVTVRVTIDGVVACVVTVAANRTWSCVPRESVPNGRHTLTATAVDAAGNWNTSRMTTFFVNVV